MKYSEEFYKFIDLKSEEGKNHSEIARLAYGLFTFDCEVETVRKKISTYLASKDIKKKLRPRKRLFFDIEKTYCEGWFWRTGKTSFISPNQIFKDSKIICISYKWEYEDEVHTLVWTKKQDDQKMIKDFIKIMGEADELIGHNSDRFDIKEIRTRAIFHRELMYPTYRTLDTLKKARAFFNFPSNKLDEIGRYFKVGRKLDHEGIDLWHKVIRDKDENALLSMVKYCEQDVLLLEQVFTVMQPYITHNTNYAVLNGLNKYNCPNCSSTNVDHHRTDTTPMGWIRHFMRCGDCKQDYKISNKTYMNFLLRTLSGKEL